MKMKLRLDYNGKNIINWQPDENQWWITGFNPEYQNVHRDDLTATFTVKFDDGNMYTSFMDDNRDKVGWIFSGSNTATFSF